MKTNKINVVLSLNKATVVGYGDYNVSGQKVSGAACKTGKTLDNKTPATLISQRPFCFD